MYFMKELFDEIGFECPHIPSMGIWDRVCSRLEHNVGMIFFDSIMRFVLFSYKTIIHIDALRWIVKRCKTSCKVVRDRFINLTFQHFSL